SEAANPAFGYGAPHLSARGTSTLLNNALLSTRFLFADRPTAMRSTCNAAVPQVAPCSSRTRRLRSRSHLRASKTPARDGPCVATRRELREQKARSSGCYSRAAEDDFCQRAVSAGRSLQRVALPSA